MRLGKDGLELPIAFIRVEPRTKYRLEGAAPSASESEPANQQVVPAGWKPGSDLSDMPDDSPGHFVATEEVWKRLETVSLTGRGEVEAWQTVLGEQG